MRRQRSLRSLASLALLATLAAPAVAQAQAPACANQGTGLYFGNGVNVDSLDADAITRDALPGLAQEAGIDGRVSFATAYNQTNGLFDDLLETMEQKVAEDSRFTWFMLNNIVGYLIRGVNVPTRILDRVPGGAAFVAELQERINQTIAAGSGESTAFYDADVGVHSASYVSDLRRGYRVMVVAHSQGNLYANAARRQLGSLPAASSSFGVDAVATPAETASDGYVSSDSDLVIGLLRTLGRTVLPANVSVPVSGDDFLGHGFEDIYVNAQLPARSRVVSVLSSLDQRLEYPEVVCSPEPEPGAPSLAGSYVRFEGHCCEEPSSEATLIGTAREATVSTGVEFADLSGVRGNIHLIAADIDVLDARIDVTYNENITSSPGTFNGYVLTFSGSRLPQILGAEFSDASTVDLGNASVSVDGTSVLINLPSTAIQVGSVISVSLTLQ